MIFCHDVHNSGQIATPRWLRKVVNTFGMRTPVASTIPALAYRHTA